MKALCHEIAGKFDLGSNAETDLFPSFYLIEIQPDLRLADENEFCSLPWPCLSPEISETIERKPVVEEIQIPHTCKLEIMYLLPAT
jgi:hypothetical protein